MTPRQKKCFEILMYHFDQALDELMRFESDLDQWLEELDKKLDQTAIVVDAAAAGAAIGVLIAPVTAGTSLSVTAVCALIVGGIKIGRTIDGCARALNKMATPALMSPACESAFAAFKLSTRVGLVQIADAITVHYSHIINEVMEECSLPIFASYAVNRVLKKLKIDLKEQLKTYKNPTQAMKVMLVPEVFIDYLLQSVTLSMKSEKIILNPQYCSPNWMGSREMPVKWAFSRSRLVLPTALSSSSLSLSFYASLREGHFLSDGTFPCYGYVMLQLLCNRSVTVKMNHRDYQLLNTDLLAERAVRQHLTFYYAISKQDVQEYLETLRDIRSAKIYPNVVGQSLNEFLSERYEIKIIAVIQGNVLSDLDLSQGNFSHVVGYDVLIERSNLKGTRWDFARLPHSVIQDVETDEKMSFKGAYLEFSALTRFRLIGDWSNARINFSTLIDCVISTRMLDKTTNWSWVIHNNVTIEDMSAESVANIEAAAEENIEEYDVKLQTQLQQKFEDMHRAIEEVQQSEAVHAAELSAWYEEQKHIELRQVEITQQIFEQLYILKTQPEVDLLRKINDRFKTLYRWVIAQPHVDLWVKVGNMEKSNMFTFILSLIESEAVFSASVIEGTLGSGKTTDVGSALVSLKVDAEIDIDALGHLEGERLSGQKHEEWVFEVFSLWKVRDFTEEDLLTACLNRNGYVTTEEVLLLKQKPCLFVLDGLEDCQVDINQRALIDEIYRRHADWKKLIILVTVTSEFITKTPSFYERMSYGAFAALPEGARVRVLPFTKDQIDTYFRLYFPKQLSLSDPLFSAQFPVKEIYRMAKSPIMAHIICEVFSGKAMGRIPHTHVQFCKAFLELWYLSIQDKARNSNLALKPMDIQDFVKTLAFEMFTRKQLFINRPFENERGLFQQRLEEQRAALEPSMIALIFTDPKCKKAGTLMPLAVEVVNSGTAVMVRYKFLHKFIYFFALAMKLIDILEHESLDQCLAGWNADLIVEREIYLFMEGLFKEQCLAIEGNEALMLDKLRAIVLNSARDHSKSIAASNAIMMLNHLRYDFSHHIQRTEWRGIQVPGANLRYAKLARLDFLGGNFRNVQLQHAEYAGVNFQGCDTTGTRFLSDAEKHHYVTRRPKAMTSYINDTVDVITYAIPLGSGEAAHKIINLGLDGKKYPSMDGHKSEVLCMEWGLQGLISSSKRGTIYYWSDQCEKMQTFKYDQKIPIYSLSWHSQGYMFASGGADGFLYLWDIRRPERYIQKIYEGGALRYVLFGQSMLLTGGDLGHLHVWSYANHETEYTLIIPMIQNIDFMSAIHCMVWSPDESVIGIGLKNGQICLHTIASSRFPEDAFIGHRNAVNSLAWHKNGELLISGGEDGSIRTWHVKEHHCLSVFYGDGTPIDQLCILVDGHRVIAAQDRMLSIWNIETTAARSQDYAGEIEHRIKCIVAYNNVFVTGHVDGSVNEWCIDASGRKIVRLLHQHSSPVQQMILSPDERYLATFDSLFNVSIHDPHENSTILLTLSETTAEIQQLHWIRDSEFKFYLTAATNKGVFIWALNAAGQWYERPAILTEDTQCIVGQKAGNQCALARGAEIIILSYFSENRFEEMHRLTISAYPIVQLAWSSDERWLALIDESSSVYLWSAEHGLSQCVDSGHVDEKKVSWVEHNGKLCLLISSLEEVKLVEMTARLSMSVKRISSGAERVAVNHNKYYLVDKMSVDVMQLMDDRLVYMTRVGVGLCTRDANLQDAILRDDESKALEIHGAIVPTKSWFANLGFFSSTEPVCPLPARRPRTQIQKRDSPHASGVNLGKFASKWSLDEDTESSSPSNDSQEIDITAASTLPRRQSSPTF